MSINIEDNIYGYEEDLENWPDGVELPSVPRSGHVDLPNGCWLYWKENDVGGRTYFSDEIGGGTFVWDTALIADSTMLTALTTEAKLAYEEYHWNKCMKRKNK